MLTKEDLNQLKNIFGELLGGIKKEITDTSLKLEGRLVSVEHRLRSVETLTKETGLKPQTLRKALIS